MPTKEELIANGRTTQQIAAEIGADGVVFQDLTQLVQCVGKLNPNLQGFDTSCFDGHYLTGNIDDTYLNKLSQSKKQC